jgi:hypothetical protein
MKTIKKTDNKEKQVFPISLTLKEKGHRKRRIFKMSSLHH